MKSDSWIQGRRAVLRVAFSIAVASCLGAGLSAAAPRTLGLGGPAAPVIDGDGADLIDFAAGIGEAGCGFDVEDGRDDLVLTDPKFISCAPLQDTDVPPDGILDYFVNGFDLRRFVVVYDRSSTALYLLWRTEGLIGDVDGNTNPDNTICQPYPSYPDQTGLGSNERYQAYFDTNCDGNSDIIISVGGGSGVDDVTVQGVSFSGSQLAYRQGAGTGRDLELRISGIDLPTGLQGFAYANASLDGMGEDVSARRACGSPGPGIACSIAAPDTRVCAGETVEICGPEGAYTYSWSTGATSRCIAVGAGTWSLVLASDVTGCIGSSKCSVTVVEDPAGCATGNCPRGAGFWAQQCAQKGNGSTKFTRAQMDQLTGCVDEAVSFFDWTNDFDSFCRLISPPTPMDQRKQAKRQFAGLVANSCADRLDLVPNNGAELLLDPDTPVDCGGFAARTIGQLIIEIDAMLATLEGEDLKSASAKAKYADIIGCADAINNGVGIPTSAMCEHGGTTTGSSTGGVDDSFVDVSGLSLYTSFPNPFNTTTQWAFEVTPDEGANVDVTIYDVSGRQIRKVVSGLQPAGRQAASWDGRDDQGGTVTRGVYFVRTVIAGTKAPVQRLLFLR